MSKPKQTSDVRTTITLTAQVWAVAERAMQSRGYNNFSAYVAERIREHADALGISFPDVDAAVAALQEEALEYRVKKLSSESGAAGASAEKPGAGAPGAAAPSPSAPAKAPASKAAHQKAASHAPSRGRSKRHG